RWVLLNAGSAQSGSGAGLPQRSRLTRWRAFACCVVSAARRTSRLDTGARPRRCAARPYARRSSNHSLMVFRCSCPGRSSWRSHFSAPGWCGAGPSHPVSWSAATVAAGRVLSVLRLDVDIASPVDGGAVPQDDDLVDEATGLIAPQAMLTAVVIADPDLASSTAARLGRLTDTPGDARVTLGGVALDTMPLAEVRRRILVLDRDPQLLIGTLRDAVDAPSARVDEAERRPS